MIPTLLLVSMLVFAMVHLTPGDPVLLMLSPDEATDLEVVQAQRERLGLDRPMHEQFVGWLLRVASGDLGRSIKTRQPVTEAIFQRLPVTLQLSAYSLTFAVLLAIPLGVLAAAHRGRFADTAASVTAVLGISTPNMFLSSLLIYIFAYHLRLLPPSGYVPPSKDLIQNLLSFLMPCLTLGTSLMGSVMRTMRSSLLDALREEYIVTARSKGLSERTVTYRHAMKNALNPVVTVIGLQTAGLMGGAFIIEQIFALPGIGKLAVDSIYARDIPVVQGVVLLVSVVFMVINLMVDIAYVWLDPRIRYT